MITFSKLGNFGRLGNQLFQISASIGLAKKNGDNAKFYKWEYSEYFKNQIDQTLNQSEIVSSYTERYFNYHPIPYSKNLDLIGYFQSEKYFEYCSSDIRNSFEFIDEIKDPNFIDLKDSCSIHVRRGDYVNLSEYHPFPGEAYYTRSIDYMKNIGVKHFYVFSDDIEWCKNFFPNTENFHFITGNHVVKDLCLMSICNNNIIANSSFSWWGAWLNKNMDKKVIAPSVWFGPAKKGVTTADLYCKNWIII